jgi:protein involved in polysaccharide export with SLBB domain
VQIDEVSGVRIVDPSGRIYLPYLGSVGVSGLSAPQIRDLLAEEYSLLYSDPVVEVVSRLKVNVTGAVRDPGHYLLDPSSTLIDALANAGGVASEIDVGYNAASDPEKSRFVRNGELFVLDLRPNAVNPDVFSLPIQSGDWIHIPIAERSRVREQVQFWGGVVSLALSTVALVVLIGG